MSQKHADYAEKRDFIRMRVDTEVTLISAEQVIAATCLDLSSSGMQIKAPNRFQVGDKLQVRIDSEHTSLAALEAEVQVVWIADQPQNEQKLGLRIIKMT
ncbi:PilZ domain-containing protein [Pseudomonas sp. MAFF212428]|uniref:PilZ domain-containing protein n=1 Tax=Pseudomonas brassicae TaxID=2708063 RepID=A0A6B3NTX0_9PSED|nr:PilZ domain-containing protein [Pseudomonas brassicae]NER61775.1 PilZ domain-containing protein [Pseudomonas brassicae]NER66695.1 PilZ domain-containing protein [Pseudomonas brassicae]